MNVCRVCEKPIPEGILCCTECLTDHCKTCTRPYKNCHRVCEKSIRRMQAQAIVNQRKKEVMQKERIYKQSKETLWRIRENDRRHGRK